MHRYYASCCIRVRFDGSTRMQSGREGYLGFDINLILRRKTLRALSYLSDVGGQGRKRKKVDCSMKCTSRLIYMRDRSVHVSV
jgi:hypothetical protein